MRVPFGPWTSRLQRVACQIIHVEHTREGTLVDLVTLEPSTNGSVPVPAGTPLALDLDARGIAHGDWGRAALAVLLTCWEQEGSVVELVVYRDHGGLRYELTCGHDRLVLLLEPPAPD